MAQAVDKVLNLKDKTGEVATLYAKWTANQTVVTLSAPNATTAGTTQVTATYDQRKLRNIRSGCRCRWYLTSYEFSKILEGWIYIIFHSAHYIVGDILCKSNNNIRNNNDYAHEFLCSILFFNIYPDIFESLAY